MDFHKDKAFPAIFMTNDCAANRNALSKIFPQSKLLLCTFHVPQAVWRWLWDSLRNIDKDHASFPRRAICPK